MANIYSRLTKINNVSGRSDYISNPKRQEHILLNEKDLDHGWSFVSDFEKQKSNADKTNWEARELVVALPNELADDKENLKQVCDDLTENLVGNNREHEYAVHWNKDRTNLHVHILFSERERVEKLEPRTYKRDMWYDIKTNRMAKANADGAELRFKKGNFQKDKDGNIKYATDPLSSKNIKFKSRSFLLEKQYIIQDVFKEHGFNLEVQENNTPYLSQKKLYKGATEDYLKTAKEYNQEVKDYNAVVKEHLAIEPEQKEVYQEIRQALEVEIKQENRASQSFSKKAIEVVRDIKVYVKDLVRDLKQSITKIIDSTKLGDWWDKNKDELVELMNENEELENEKDRMKNFVHAVDEVIKDQENTIEEIENMKVRSIDYGPSL